MTVDILQLKVAVCEFNKDCPHGPNVNETTFKTTHSVKLVFGDGTFDLRNDTNYDLCLFPDHLLLRM